MPVGAEKPDGGPSGNIAGPMASATAYLDNAAATRPAPEAQAAVAAAEAELFANPSSAHGPGAAAARALATARVLGAAMRARGRHLVVTAIEHPAVLRNAERLAGDGGFSLTVIAPDAASGAVRAADVVAALRPDTAVVAVMLVNNELGTVQPVAEIARALDAWAARAGGGARRPHLHVDAVQAFGLLPLRAEALGADSIAISAHKIHGPKGVGALWLRPGARVAALWDGGRQERALRSGTENVPGAAGFARAAALAIEAQKSGAVARMAALRDDLEAEVRRLVPGAAGTVAAFEPGFGPAGAAGLARAPHISSMQFRGLPAEPLLHALGARGVIASAGSACASKTRGPSHVLKAIGVDDDTAVLRFSLSRHTTPDEIVHAARAVAEAVAEIAAGARAAPDRARGRVAKPDRTG